MSPSEIPNLSASRTEFTRLYNACAEWLYGYLLSLLRHPDDADEVLQETAQVLWEKFDQYHPGTEFRAWACRVAHFKALKHREKKRRRPTAFSDLFFDAVDEESVFMADRLDARLAALAKCLEKLPNDDRNLIEQRYAPQGSVQQAAESLSRSAHSIYRSLARIHETLFRCINRAIAEETAP